MIIYSFLSLTFVFNIVLFMNRRYHFSNRNMEYRFLILLSFGLLGISIIAIISLISLIFFIFPP